MMLINPPSPFLEDERVFPYLGIIQLATAWKMRGLEIEIIDLNGRKKWKKIIKEIANEDNIFGITSTSPQFMYAFQANRIIKQNNEKASQ